MGRRNAKTRLAVITPEMIEALAAEAEAGYDLSLGTVVQVGRPAPQKGSGASPRFTVRTSQGLFDAARARAKAEGRSVSELARDAVERYVKS